MNDETPEQPTPETPETPEMPPPYFSPLLQIAKLTLPREVYQEIQIEAIVNMIRVFYPVQDQEFTGGDIIQVLAGALLLIEAQDSAGNN